VKALPETTQEVVEWLGGLGLAVTEKQIANDTVDRFLPPRPVETAPAGRGRKGIWEPWMVRRAERLYRLRRRKDADGQPLVYGDTLRLLLFIRDGWGWSSGIRELCLQGFEKSVAATLAPVHKYTRNPKEREQVDFALEAHDAVLSPGQRYATGVLAFGEPLEGGSLQGIVRAAEALGVVQFPPWFVNMLQPLGISSATEIGTRVAKDMAFTAPVFRAMLSAMDDRAAQRSMPRFIREFIRPIRTRVHRESLVQGIKGQSTNLFTMFGRRQRMIEQHFREFAGARRITPSQSLALFLGCAMLGDVCFRIVESIVSFTITIALKVFRLRPPTNIEEVVPFAAAVLRRVFGVQPLSNKPAS